jgi:hypothetical protein
MTHWMTKLASSFLIGEEFLAARVYDVLTTPPPPTHVVRKKKAAGFLLLNFNLLKNMLTDCGASTACVPATCRTFFLFCYVTGDDILGLSIMLVDCIPEVCYFSMLRILVCVKFKDSLTMPSANNCMFILNE